MIFGPPRSKFGLGLLNAMNRRAGGGPIRAAVLPCKTGDGATTVVGELVKCAQMSGRTVALLDMNFMHPSVYPGLRANRLDLDDFLEYGNFDPIRCPEDGILWTGSNRRNVNLALELGLKDVQGLISRFGDDFDLVVIDGPAVLHNNLSEIIALSVDQTYMVVRQERTTQMQAFQALDRLRRLNIEPAGFIYNDRKRSIPDSVYHLFFGRQNGKRP